LIVKTASKLLAVFFFGNLRNDYDLRRLPTVFATPAGKRNLTEISHAIPT